MIDPDPDALQALQAKLLSMPPVQALQVRIAGCEGGRLRLQAPLAANVNDKGTAFGGSLVSLMTLAAWALTTLRIEQAGLEADVYVADTEVRYRAPLLTDLHAEAWLAEDEAWAPVLATLRERGKARATLLAHVLLPDGRVACEARARYAAIRKSA